MAAKDEWTEEVEYLTFDFGHSHAPSPISSYSGFQLLIYRGEYESLVGTELIMQPVSVSEKDKKTSRQRVSCAGGDRLAFYFLGIFRQSGTEEPGEEGVEQAGIDEEEQGEAEEGEEGEEGEGEEKVEMKYEPLAHTRTRIRWLPVTLTEVEGGPNESDSSSPEA
ncbi:uncharacterized protein VP01_1501g3 [Puccinia sorghi]|uniref:Transcription factor TFIIIC triple barrel domain-containing protein n=1 Tax=Puccinia sorghi TaxID=27349 RepID=A0A0L6VKX0_9BASI|nr:uncharacterized protein VP01_1501g3 [Puccinia sorghi]